MPIRIEISRPSELFKKEFGTNVILNDGKESLTELEGSLYAFSCDKYCIISNEKMFIIDRHNKNNWEFYDWRNINNQF